VIIIPARLNSYRIERKALLDIDGKPLIRHVYDRCLETGLETMVATNSDEIAKELPEGRTVRTGEAWNGSERVAKAVIELGLPDDQWIINVQGDKLVEPHCVTWFNKQIINQDPESLYCMSEYGGGGVRVLTDKAGYAKYFTRNHLPNSRRHCGIYAYTVGFLKTYLELPSVWEYAENLEQMRALENGLKVRCFEYDGYSGKSVNEPGDIGSISLSRNLQQAGILQAV